MAVLNLVGNVVGELLGAAEGAAEGAAVSKSVEPMEPSSALQWVQRSVLLMALQTDSQLDQQTEPWWAMWKVPQTALRLASCGKVTLELGTWNQRTTRTEGQCAQSWSFKSWNKVVTFINEDWQSEPSLKPET
jgi:hypothetical protein